MNNLLKVITELSNVFDTWQKTPTTKKEQMKSSLKKKNSSILNVNEKIQKYILQWLTDELEFR